MNIKQSVIKSKQKEKKLLEVETNIQSVLSLSKNENLLLSSVIFGKQSFKEYHPSQISIGKQAGVTRETVCIKTTELHDKFFIVKKDNGFKLVNYSKRIYRKHTCSYGVGLYFYQLNKDIKQYSEFPAEDYQRLIDSNPALYYVFGKNLTDIINRNIYINILSNTTRKKEINFLYQEGSEMEKIQKVADVDIFHTNITPQVCPSDAVMDYWPSPRLRPTPLQIEKEKQKKIWASITKSLKLHAAKKCT